MQRLDRRILFTVSPERSDFEEHAEESKNTRQILAKCIKCKVSRHWIGKYNVQGEENKSLVRPLAAAGYTGRGIEIAQVVAIVLCREDEGR